MICVVRIGGFPHRAFGPDGDGRDVSDDGGGADWAIALEVFRASLPRRGGKGRDDRLFLEALHDFATRAVVADKRYVGASNRKAVRDCGAVPVLPIRKMARSRPDQIRPHGLISGSSRQAPMRLAEAPEGDGKLHRPPFRRAQPHPDRRSRLEGGEKRPLERRSRQTSVLLADRESQSRRSRRAYVEEKLRPRRQGDAQRRRQSERGRAVRVPADAGGEQAVFACSSAHLLHDLAGSGRRALEGPVSKDLLSPARRRRLSRSGLGMACAPEGAQNGGAQSRKPSSPRGPRDGPRSPIRPDLRPHHEMFSVALPRTLVLESPPKPRST